MGGTPITALAIAAFPVTGFDPADMRAVFAGGLSVLQEAGVALLGGHTVQDQEVKFGYAVTGLVRPGAQWTNTGARPGDVLFLTKAIGTGIISTAIKAGTRRARRRRRRRGVDGHAERPGRGSRCARGGRRRARLHRHHRLRPAGTPERSC